MFRAEDIRCIILAAGSARRFGSSKLLYPLKDGRSILQTTMKVYTDLFDQVTVICNDNLELINQALRLNALVEVNPQSDLGMSESIKLGVGDSKPNIGWLIVLADMPYVDPISVIRLCQLATRFNIVQARVSSKPANPVLIGADFQSEIMALTGDVGAKSILQAHNEAVLRVDLEDTGLIHDIDKLSDIRD